MRMKRSKSEGEQNNAGLLAPLIAFQLNQPQDMKRNGKCWGTQISSPII